MNIVPIVLILLLIFSPFSFAERYWPATTLVEWTFTLNNGVA